jgi:hypothetical protein
MLTLYKVLLVRSLLEVVLQAVGGSLTLELLLSGL